ncbi:hypothetical protein [Aquimarina aggregata]|uniref:hypothetical protein n=1 Tax=Aquimarina aggregata TaxID=1642818 RepID=UPI0024900F8D|nr:hypothetical protein [Aquimarina aggregata]
MFLGKNFNRLFFLFFWGAVFSQEVQYREIVDTYISYALVDDNKVYTGDVNIEPTIIKVYEEDKVLSESFLNNYETKGRNESYVCLLNSLTVKEKKSKNFVLNILKINSKGSDYAPSFYNGELIFASSRDVNSISKTFDALNNQPFLDLYKTIEINNQQRVRKLKGKINSKFHESSAVFTQDKKTVYFTRNNYSKKKYGTNDEGVVLLKIYRASYYEGKWRDVEELPFNSDDYSIAHPALSPDGKHLFFASDMPGSFGKSDLYKVDIYEDGNFGTPVNLGERINTKERETFPYVSDKGNLFFASNGHSGFGGLDIFMTLPNKDGNIEVYNLGKPINSEKDDFTFIINEEHKTGYLASNRDGGKGDDDIYGFKQLVSFPKQYNNRLRGVKKIERVIDLKITTEEITSW